MPDEVPRRARRQHPIAQLLHARGDGFCLLSKRCSLQERQDGDSGRGFKMPTSGWRLQIGALRRTAGCPDHQVVRCERVRGGRRGVASNLRLLLCAVAPKPLVVSTCFMDFERDPKNLEKNYLLGHFSLATPIGWGRIIPAVDGGAVWSSAPLSSKVLGPLGTSDSCLKYRKAPCGRSSDRDRIPQTSREARTQSRVSRVSSGIAVPLIRKCGCEPSVV